MFVFIVLQIKLFSGVISAEAKWTNYQMTRFGLEQGNVEGANEQGGEGLLSLEQLRCGLFRKREISYEGGVDFFGKLQNSPYSMHQI